MNESTLDLLISAVDHILSDKSQVPSNSAIAEALSDAGMSSPKVKSTLAWFEGLIDVREQTESFWAKHSDNHNRVFSIEEQNKLSSAARHFLVQLESMNVVSPELRERIIDSAMTCDQKTITLSQIEWIAALILANQKLPDSSEGELRQVNAFGQYDQRLIKH